MSDVSFSIPEGSDGKKGLEHTSEILNKTRSGPAPSSRRLRKVESIECVRLRRQSASQNLGFSSRPFVLCGLPIKCPPPGTLVHERRNGQFVLLVTGHPNYGLPLGPGSPRPPFPGNLGDPPADPPDHLPERRRNAGYLRYATGRIPIPPVSRRLPAYLRRHDLLRD